jgi:hypothetical protein
MNRLQARQGQDAKEKVAESAQDYNGKGVLFQPYHPKTVLPSGPTQQHTATAAVSAALSCTGLHPVPWSLTNSKYQVSSDS